MVTIKEYQLTIHETSGTFVIEVNPRVGTWSPFVMAIPAVEKTMLDSSIMYGQSGTVPLGGVIAGSRAELAKDGKWWLMAAAKEATPTRSYYLFCRRLPSEIIFGVNGGKPQYKYRFNKKDC